MMIIDANLLIHAINTDSPFELVSCDADFAKFPGLRWINPIAS